MKRIVLFLVVCVCVYLTLPLGSTSAKDTWHGMHSKNFYLLGNANERDIRQVATKLEQFRQAFGKVFPNTRPDGADPITVIVFKNHNSFVPFMPVHNGKVTQVGGYFQPSDEGRFILLTAEMEGDYPYSTIFHEFVHTLTEDSSRPLPTWLNEGLAELYSTFTITGDKKINLGIPIASHIYTLRQTKFFPLQQLFEIKTDSDEYNEGNKQTIFYAESWALVHYLIMGNGGKRQPQLHQFIQLINSGKSSDEAYRESFDISYEGLQQELQHYIQNSSYHYVTLTLDDKLDFDKETQSIPISDAEAEYQLGKVLSLQLRSDAEQHLRNAIAADPNHAEAQAVLGKLLMWQGKVDEAKEHLEKAVAANSKSYMAHFYYAFALSREGSEDKHQLVNRFPTANIPQIRAELIKAIQLNPYFIESYHLLGFVNLVDGKEIDETIQLMNRALTISPGNESVNFVLGQLYAHKQDYDTARKIIEPLTRTAKTPEMRASAQMMLRQIDSAAEQMARYKEYQNRRNSGADTDSFYNRNGNTSSGDKNTSAPTGPPTLKRRGADESPDSGLCVHYSGEQMRGFLTKIECPTKGIGMTLCVQVEGKTVKFQVSDPSQLRMVSCGVAGNEEFQCGALSTPRLVTVFYEKLDTPKVGIDGRAMAVVFMEAK
ncbi:MAG TPA: tetratricopeptide repeat protein [Blastocatellia bacterium]|nr:tetratricopeptide repeat protein [Blastocatellia bacterium]